MSTNNLARFYWAKLERATAILEGDKPEGARDIFLQLANEFECPRFCQVEALKLHSRCYPDNYWFAKSSLDRAYEICLSCESSYRASKRDLEALAEVKKGVETMLHVHTTQYREHWKSKGKNPPTEDEWYEIAEAEEDETRGSAGDWLEVAKDENGVALSGPVKAWPFEGPVPDSFLEGKTYPPKAGPEAQ